ncbi:MAG: extracellular solute-binding protein [Eubacteriales bacterium]|nr:extracellular solute-binding protein [Eubacteriales bacterium]
MLRYIIGISVLTLGIIIVRALSNGKILRKYQYAFWLVIPLFMILFHFVRIDLPNATELKSLFSHDAETTICEVTTDVAPTVQIENVPIETARVEKSINLEPHSDPEAAEKKEQIANYVASTSENTRKANQKTETSFKNFSYAISSILIILLIAYNVGFVSYCKRKREFIGRDHSSGLKIYSIRHKEVPFLLFNNIYIDNSSEDVNEYVICHEVCHYKRGDHIWILIRYLVLFLNWYNPLIWVAFILSGHDCELACDEEVMRVYGAGASKDYSRTLFGMLQQQSDTSNIFSLSTGMRSGYRMMRKRLISIKKPAKMSRKALALSLSAILLFTSCSFIKTPKQPRKITEDTPWFESVIIDVDSGADPDRKLESCYQDFSGSDEKYIVVLTTGRYEQPPEEEIDWNTYNYNDYNFSTVSVIDRKTCEVVNTIDLTDVIDKDVSTYECIDATVYSEGKIIVKTNSKERVYDPLTGEMLDIRDSKSNRHSNSKYYKVGNYLIDARQLWDNYSHYVINIKSPDGKVSSIDIDEVGTDIYVSAVLATDDNTALIPASTSKGKRFYILDLTNNELTIAENKDYEWVDVDYLNYSFTGSDGEVYYRAYDGIYRVDLAQKNNEKVFDFSWCGINRGLINQLDIAECFGDSFILIGQTETASIYSDPPHTFQIIELTKADRNPHAGKTVLTLNAEWVDEHTGKAIEVFNKTSEEFFIEVTNRYQGNGNAWLEDGVYEMDEDEQQIYFLNSSSGMSNEIAMDIMNGDGPDILFNTFMYDSLNNSEYLVDLTPYIGNLDSDEYFTNIIEGSKTGDAVYQLPVTYAINGIFTDAENAGSSGVGFTLDEYHSFVKTTLNGTDLIPSGQAFYFSFLFSSMSDTFISDGKADFTGPEFKELAEYVKNYVPEKSSSMENIPREVLQIAEYGHGCYGIGRLFQKYNEQIKNPTVLGTPSIDGRGPMFSTLSSVAISAKATNIDACAEFVKILLSDEIQTDYALDDYFVLNRNSFREAAETAIDYYNNGGQAVNLGNGMDLINGEPFTDKDIDNVERIILSCSTLEKSDADISKILVEEMPPYFLDQKDLDSVIKIAQDRVQKVLDERG